MNYETFLIGTIVGFLVGSGVASFIVAFIYTRSQAAHFAKMMDQLRACNHIELKGVTHG